jgi:hypothetical protein
MTLVVPKEALEGIPALAAAMRFSRPPRWAAYEGRVQAAADRVDLPAPAHGMNLCRCFPQGLKPSSLCAVYGTTEVVPFQNMDDHLWVGHH